MVGVNDFVTYLKRIFHEPTEKKLHNIKRFIV